MSALGQKRSFRQCPLCANSGDLGCTKNPLARFSFPIAQGFHKQRECWRLLAAAGEI
jgi:hypothetical protein